MRESEQLVSVIIPAYNSVQFIGRTIESVTAQSHREIEIIVVDDGSTDDTAEVVSALARNDSRIRLFGGTHRGLPATRNFAAAQARGSFLAPCDSDDLWHPEKISLQLAALRESPAGTGVAYCWSTGVNEEDAVIFPDWAHGTVAGNVFHEMIVDSLPGNGSAVLIRRSLFDAVGGFPEEIAHGDEWQLYISLAATCSFALVRQSLVGYRFRTNNMSNDFRAVEESLARTTAWIVATWPDTPPYILRRRAHTVNCYLSFLAVRNGRFRTALNFRLNAWMALPATLLSVPTLGFFLMMFGRVLGLQRYYYRFWRAPATWEGATLLRTRMRDTNPNAPPQ